MERLKKNGKILNSYLKDFLAIANTSSDGLRSQLVIDKETHTYLLLTFGWHPDRFIHFVAFHFEIKPDGKIWLYQNRTSDSVVEELTKRGVAKQDIIIGFIETYETAQAA